MTCLGALKHFSESENFMVITFAESRRNKGYMADELQEASGLKEVPSSEILSKIKRGEPTIEYDHVRITGDFDIGKLDMPLNGGKYHIVPSIKIISSVFNGTVNFSESHFQKYIDFTKTKFDGSAKFIGSIFSSGVSFLSSKFESSTWFERCDFQGNVMFHNAEFRKLAIFNESIFNNDSIFIFK